MLELPNKWLLPIPELHGPLPLTSRFAALSPPCHSALSVAATLGGYGPGSFSAATTASTEVDGTYATSKGTATFNAFYGRADVFVQDSARPILTTLG